MKNFEIISAFCQYPMGHKTQLGEKRMPYNPQGLVKIDAKVKRNACKFGNIQGKRPSHKQEYLAEYTNYPKAILYFNQKDNSADHIHPTQKPVDLLRYLILTYTNENDVVFDSCMGSASTAIAAIKEHRHFIGFELNKEYYDKACQRIKREQQQLSLF